MKTAHNLSLLIFFPILFNSCKKEPEINPETNNKILILGASRVEGNPPYHESFRYELWKLLTADSLTFDFVGTESDNNAYPNYLGKSFDTDHEGRSGWTAKRIYENLPDWLSETDPPDIVIFSTPGGNDALLNLPYSNTISYINSIIDIIQESNSDCEIIVEIPAPGHSEIMQGTLAEYFENLKTDLILIAETQTTEKSDVLTVNMHQGFTDEMLADKVHYNGIGAKFIAEKHYEVLKEIIQ
tara:strand:+ start:2325 stop:3050 length:726 start_codon:yes stop_codon:yes gene_type:complete